MLINKFIKVNFFIVMNLDKYLALDTEFVWNRTYYAKLGLIQAAFPKGTNILNYSLAELIPFGRTSESQELLLIDPFEAFIEPLANALEDSSIVKLLHASMQDLQHLNEWCGALPKNIFDTSVAAAYCGFGANISLQKLFKELLDVELPKTETQSDWCQRPLTEEQVEYAIDDVALLPSAVKELCKRSQELGSFEFLVEDLKLLDEPDLYIELPTEQIWKKFSPSSKLLKDRKATARYCALMAWREELARKYDVPRVRIAENGAIVAASLHLPKTESAAINAGIKHRYLGDYMASISEIAGAELPEELAKAEQQDGFAIEKFIKYARPIVDALSEELHIASQYVASKRDLTAWFSEKDSSANKINCGWRAEHLRPKLLRCL